MGAGQVTRALVVMLQLKVRLKVSNSMCQTYDLQAFPYLTTLIGMEGIFFLHSTTLLLGAAFALAALPETRNKSLTQLEQIFVKKERKKESGCCCCC